MVAVRMTRAKALMLSTGITCVALAEAAGVSRPNLSMLLCGRRKPSGHIAQAVSDVLGWDGDPMDLFVEITLKEE